MVRPGNKKGTHQQRSGDSGSPNINNNNNNTDECHPAISELLRTNESVLQRLATSTVAIQKLEQENNEMKSIVQSTRDQLLQLNESLKRSEAFEKRNIARMQSERDRALNKESQMQKDLQELQAKVIQLLELNRRSVNNGGVGNSMGGEQNVTSAANGPLERQSLPVQLPAPTQSVIPSVPATSQGVISAVTAGQPQRKPPATNDVTDKQPPAAGQKQDGRSFESIDNPSRKEQRQRSPPNMGQQPLMIKKSDEKQTGLLECKAKPPPSQPPQIPKEQLIKGKEVAKLGGNGNKQIVVAGIMPPPEVHSTKGKEQPSSSITQYAEKPPPTRQVKVSLLPNNKGITAKKADAAVVEFIADDDHKKQELKLPAQMPSQPVENEPNAHQSVEEYPSKPPPPPAEVPKITNSEQASLPRGTAKAPPIQHTKAVVVGENIINNKVEAATPNTSTDRLTTGPKRKDASADNGGAVVGISPSRHSSKNGVPSDSRLSLYLYPKQQNRRNNDKGTTAISPIFDLLQNQSTLETGRTLLKYEGEMWTRKKELRDLQKKKKTVEIAVLDEHKQDTKYATEISTLNKERRALEKSMGSWNPLLRWWDKDSDDEDDGGKTKPVDDKDDVGSGDDEDGDGDEDSDGGKEESGGEEEGISDLTVFARKKIARKMAKKETNRKERATKSRHAKGLRMNVVIEETKRIEKLKSAIPDRITSLNQRITQWDQAIDSKVLLIEELRAKFAEIKGAGSQEDENFDMDDSRDENGHTFLMVAAQNNDIDTAQLCFTLNAHPNATSPEGHTAMVFAYYFGFDAMVTLIAQHGGTYPAKLAESWSSVEKSMHTLGKNPVDWDVMLRIAQQAAIPTESVLASAEALEKSEESRMAILPREERTRRASFFGASLVNPKHVFRRVILLDESVYNWYFGTTVSEKLAFVAFLDSLDRLETFQCHRRAVVGLKNAYEVNCASLESKRASPVTLFTPFVASVVDGVCDVGIIVWTVTTDDKASLFKTLIQSTEFLRHKEDIDELFPQCLDGVLKFGADMDLLDLKSTTILTSKPMDLYILSIDDGDLQRLKESKYSPQKRITHFEKHLRKAVFHASKAEAEDGQNILSAEQHYGMSTSLLGGAGTGKTLLLIKKVISEPLEKRILVVARLPRLVSEIRRAVSAERDVTNVTFSTYNDLLALLAREVKPADEAEHCYFSALTQIHFGETTGTGLSSSVSFVEGFIQNCLEENERKAMRANHIEPITLWTAFRDIKSNVKCSLSKRPLCREEYLGLSTSFGLRNEQRELVFNLFLRYEEWRQSHGSKWDEADRLLYIMKYGPSVFAHHDFVSWEERAYKRGEIELLEEADGDSPLTPFFYHMVFADEAQDLTELDLALFLRMSGGLGSLFLGADPAQSVEIGVQLRAGTINDVFHASLPVGRKGNMTQVKHVLQEIQMRRNHRTHAQNLAIANAIRRMMARSFGIAASNEVALVRGPIPELLSVSKVAELADTNTFKGGNIVFLVPDEILDKVRNECCRQNISNDVFGVREVKGLEMEAVALLGFFSYIDHLGSANEWDNSLRWLASKTGITTTSSSEKIRGRQLANCDYRLSNPEVLDQAMMLYTALTRVRKNLYIIEVAEYGKKQKGGASFQDSAFRHLLELGLAKSVKFIDEGFVEMTPQQHKVRGALLVTQAIALARIDESTAKVKETFELAADRFRPHKGNEKDLLEQCEKHCQAILMKRKLRSTVDRRFLNHAMGAYDLRGAFGDILNFEAECSEFFTLCVGDSFLVEDVSEMRKLIEDLFRGTPYETRFGDICRKIKNYER